MKPGSSPLETEFLSAERAPDFVVAHQHDAFTHNELLTGVLNAMPEGVVILNKERQIVFANTAFYAVAEDDVELVGARLGEALACEHNNAMPAGCGTSKFCQTCGAAKAMQSALDQRRDTQECRIARSDESAGNALDLRVVATPFLYSGEAYALFAVDDISSEKRRQVLERIFFHDIQNTAGAIFGVVEILDSLEPTALDIWHEYGAMLKRASHQLLEEIQEQRQLISAETGDLYVEVMPIRSTHLLAEVRDIYINHNVAHGKHVLISADVEEVVLWSDAILARRVVGNMTKNALEASLTGATVTLGCTKEDEGVRFWVHNQNVIPYTVQLQLFKRSFSTKGYGRGLGTYSMKLLTERYLNGRIGFASSPEEGTTFFVWLPLQPTIEQ
ncbi:PAS domain-containing protein [bacterium]|nr:PAS domain-containing protein [bacterium]